MSQQSNFADLMQAGRVAYTAGKRKMAHDLWREAANIDPYNEQVWLALLDVIESDSDKRVCLQNILAINPMNVQARRQLGKIDTRLQRGKLHQAEQTARNQGRQRVRRSLLRRALLLGVAIGLSGIFFGIVASIILYGGLL
jgi:ferric-dicitrate binding protein FerR (iron transport regulator)